MKLSDLKRADGTEALAGSVRVEVNTYWPPGIAGLFADGVLVVNSTDDDLRELRQYTVTWMSLGEPRPWMMPPSEPPLRFRWHEFAPTRKPESGR